MLVVKVLILYLIFYSISVITVIYTEFNNPAVAFFVPSIFAMCFLGRAHLSKPKAESFKLAIVTGFAFASLTVLLSWILQQFTGWIKHSAQLMYFMAFVGNIIFPLMIFPKIKHAQNS